MSRTMYHLTETLGQWTKELLTHKTILEYNDKLMCYKTVKAHDLFQECPITQPSIFNVPKEISRMVLLVNTHVAINRTFSRIETSLAESTLTRTTLREELNNLYEILRERYEDLDEAGELLKMLEG